MRSRAAPSAPSAFALPELPAVTASRLPLPSSVFVMSHRRGHDLSMARILSEPLFKNAFHQPVAMKARASLGDSRAGCQLRDA